VKRPAERLDGVSRETGDRLAIFAELLLRWNGTINLISRRDEPLLWTRHIADSLALMPALPRGLAEAADFGSGGGFPGLVLAIATGCHFHLVESDRRKSAFLREAARATSAPATIHAVRIEAASLPAMKLITARAVASLATLLDWATPHLAPGGICLFPKGRTVEQELTAAAEQWQMRVERFPSPSDPAATILRLSEIARAGPTA
jgi:16S rRNA (guanine527-N7)-methyltransferase